MSMRMLIDARHREETRVAVVKGNRIEEFDFESSDHRQLKGNIYLAKVTRVEPSLQAAFVDYGGNRHGFLAFSEIHPDYYQIPSEDREALLREEAEHAEEEERLRAAQDAEEDEDEDDAGEPIGAERMLDDGDDDRPEEPENEDEDEGTEAKPAAEETGNNHERAAEDLRRRRMALRRRYKIQDVIHRRQVLLVQVVKEERGNKGAALTTYLSLAGRYCVLMPNTSHGGGISRKISNASDRKRLKAIMADLNLPRSMGCIVRTAGLQRTKVEIKRDFDYLARLWDEVRETTLGSTAPALIYKDSDLIKRAIRDIYNKDIDEVIVEGDEGYVHAKQFMKLLMPSHAKRVRPYADPVPLFQRHGVEDQLAAMYNPVVQLKSGGYLVINPTEALVSIDINSGRSTREHGIEQTAVATNLEAAWEIARQLRLRDMAGLVVIDFIDMENNSNVRKVEKAMKQALADDRARIQVGRISSFGLLEMSRQRLRTGVLEASTRQCPHCEGTGLVRTASSAALSALRLIEEEAGRGRGSAITLKASQEAAFYVLNRKRGELGEIEQRYGVRVEILPDGEIEGARMIVEASGPPPAFTPRFEPPALIPDDDIADEVEGDEEEERLAAGDEGQSGDRDERRRRRRRRRGKRGQRDEVETGLDSDARDADTEEGEQADPVEAAPLGDEDGQASERRSRRGRRGGRRRRGGDAAQAATLSDDASLEAPAVDETPLLEAALAEPVPAEDTTEPVLEDVPVIADAPVEEEKPKRRRTRKAADLPAGEDASAADVTVEAKPKRTRRAKPAPVEAEPETVTAAGGDAAEKPKRRRRTKADAAPGAAPLAPADDIAPSSDATPAQADVRSEEPEADAPAAEPAQPRKRGWWQRTLDTLS